MPRYIDLDKIPESAYWCRDALAEALENADIVDAVEVIRCKDCKHFIRDISCVEGHYDGCDEWTDNGNEIMVTEDDFCSYAERCEE